jgi:uncharacterized protein YxeA
MRRNNPTIFAILALLIMILCSACISQPPANQTSGNNAGLAQITVAADSTRISFEEARQILREYRSDSLNESADGKTAYYMLSRDVDEAGNATSWIFGVSSGSAAEFLVYDKTGMTTIPWNATLPAEAIVTDSIVSPGSLFSQNKAVIAGSSSPAIPERWDLELQRGIYTLTIISGNSSRSLTFNATTGALIA